jgi:hypothetical protein
MNDYTYSQAVAAHLGQPDCTCSYGPCEMADVCDCPLVAALLDAAAGGDYSALNNCVHNSQTLAAAGVTTGEPHHCWQRTPDPTCSAHVRAEAQP